MSLSSFPAPIHKNVRTTMGRINGFYSSNNIFSSINLSSKIYLETQSTRELTTFPILGPHGTWKEYSKEDILNAPYIPAIVGEKFGPTWTTHWFRVSFDPPSSAWNGKEIHFRFFTGTEAMLYDQELNVLQGLSPNFRDEYVLTTSYTSNPVNIPLQFYVEMACNHISGGGFNVPGHSSMILPPDPNRFWNLELLDLAVFSRENFNFLVSIEQLYGIADQLPDTHVGMQSMFVANEMVTLFSEGKTQEGNELAEAFFAQGAGSKAHTLYAMGHCHIDSAWLWPYDETIRKCARSFSAQLKLMEEYPLYKFVCSSAQHYAWIEEYYPDLFLRIGDMIRSGKFVPVGGAWVELDGNIPSGESFIRQFYYGQKYFVEKFGPEFKNKEFWLPDTFGYSSQIPQILKHVGIEYFFTAKMSWSLVNKFPNHQFWWEGIDGTRVLAAMPAGSNFNMGGTVQQILESQNNSTDKGRSNVGVYLYGHGDGGGGPTRQIIERLKRVENVDGMPKIIFSDTATFLEALEKEKTRISRWCGELYLELHNGTYTSQGQIKWFNRKGEFFFREVELLMAMAYLTERVSLPVITADQLLLDSCWKQHLLNQFHDVLPGSCIQLVTEDAWAAYTSIFRDLTTLRARYSGYILGTGGNLAIYNSLPWEVSQVLFMTPGEGQLPPEGPTIQYVTLSSEEFVNQGEGQFRVPSTFVAAKVRLSASGFSEFLPIEPTTQVTFSGGIDPTFGTYSNGKLTLEVDILDGKPVERLFLAGGEPAFNDYLNIGISPGMLYFYDDWPEYWDAWDIMDYHLESRREIPINEITTPIQNFGEGPLVAGYKWGASFGDKGSSFVRYTIMRADSPLIEYYLIIDWKEDRKLIKVEFPMDVLSREATYEIQYGHTKRPTHINTSWDMAKYEVCGHKWMDISQADKGVSVITDSKYGWHVRDNMVQLSLLKSPKVPDANCDMQKHYIYYAVMPHKGSFQESGVIQEAYNLNELGCNNIPLVPTSLIGSDLPSNIITSLNPAVIVEAVKVSNLDTAPSTRTICIRVYEAYGGYAETVLSVSGFQILKVFESNGLEEVGGEEVPVSGNGFKMELKPFQIKTFLITF